MNKQECYEECNYQWGRDIEACSRKKNPEKRGQCYVKANDRLAQCKRDGDKKYPEEDGRCFTRILTFHPKSGGAPEEVRVTVHDPERDPKGPDYRVLVRLEASGAHQDHHVHGIDGMQCIVEALFLLPTLLKGFPGPGHHTWHGRADLGLVRSTNKGSHE